MRSVAGNPTVRLFVGSLLASADRQPFVEYQAALRHAGWQGAFVRPETLHLTYAFLGDTPVSAISEVIQRIEAVLPRQSLPVLWDVTGTFGPRARPRVLWAGSRRPALGLIEWARRIGDVLGPWIATSPGAWTPHVTLLRIKHVPDSSMRPVWHPFTTRVTAIQLIESRLTPDGPVYRVLTDFSLND
ncbi:2'-5' RNA ligase [Sulfobacillus acidophilus DSM 10332]|uniref:RNA 2',3'-cyclic phosphodiesterase n=1 Tax=Sulfobacillus acidophilus (strain ATCC 700253 / DSM 10332 / NAL) TaxID=679936 RepID=G8TWL7_SULAD|nr:2'-5' RNA ligase [Sulfobacillus acidophilus DSM 10332]